jgi:hypothetical protein
MPTPRLSRPAPATLIAFAALFVALGGPAQAKHLLSGRDLRADSITAREVKRSSLTSAEIRNRSLRLSDLSPSTVGALMVTPPGSIGPAQLADRGVGAVDLADGAVSAGKLAAGAVTGPKLAPAAVDGATVADGSLTSADLAPGAVRGAQLADNSVDGSQIMDGRLQQRDVASFGGTFSWDPPDLTAGQCTASAQPAAQLSPTGVQDLRDDVIAITPPGTWPPGLTVTARATAQQELTVVVCAIDGADAGPSVFRYAAFDG